MAIPMAIDIVQAICAIVDQDGWITDQHKMLPYLTDQRQRFTGSARMIVKPTTVEQVAEIIRMCAQEHYPIVPQGGNTSLVGGAVPFETEQAIVINLARMNRVCHISPLDYTITAEAGCTLQSIQKVAKQHRLRFPLSLKAEERCQIGGCISTNAGGLRTIRYGNTRDLILGLEVVLPDGRIFSSLRSLYKDNTGYDFKHLFIGAEGTLGIITAAVLKLFPEPHNKETLFIALDSLADAVTLFWRMREQLGDVLQMFELIPHALLESAQHHIPGVINPLPQHSAWYVLCQAESSVCHQQVLKTALQQGLLEHIQHYTFAQHQEQEQLFGFIRHAIIETQKYEGVSVKNDVAVPISCLANFVEHTRLALQKHIPGIRYAIFGHIGDGNLHFNLLQPLTMDADSFRHYTDDIHKIVHDQVLTFGGTLSAEHGIGRVKMEEMRRMKGSVAMEVMHALKRLFDPHAIMNPRKVVEPP